MANSSAPHNLRSIAQIFLFAQVAETHSLFLCFVHALPIHNHIFVFCAPKARSECTLNTSTGFLSCLTWAGIFVAMSAWLSTKMILGSPIVQEWFLIASSPLAPLWSDFNFHRVWPTPKRAAADTRSRQVCRSIPCIFWPTRWCVPYIGRAVHPVRILLPRTWS